MRSRYCFSSGTPSCSDSAIIGSSSNTVRATEQGVTGSHGRAELQGRASEEAGRDSWDRRHQAAPGIDGEQHPPGRHGGPGERQQRGPHPAQAEGDRREDPSGHRRGAVAHGEGDLRYVPRLRRTDRRSAAQCDPVDPRLHRVQGKAELVTELLPLLQEFHRDKLELLLRHEAGARLIPQYDVNNTYQYIINRDEVQLTWLETAIAELGGAVHPQSEPQRSIPGKRPEVARRVIEEDARDSQAFVDRWRPRVEAMANARHAKMLGLV